MHPETLVLKEGVDLSEVQMDELQRQRRMQRQPELSTELDHLVNWLHDFLKKKKAKKTVQQIAQAIENRDSALPRASTCYSKCGRFVPIEPALLRHLCVQGHSCFIVS